MRGLDTTGFVLLLAALLLSAAVGLHNTGRLAADGERVAHTYRALAQIDDVVSAVVDAETRERGYLVTGQPPYLGPYREAVARVRAGLEELGRLTEGDGGQVRRLGRVRRLAEERVALLDAAVKLRREQGAEAARRAVLSGEGLGVMEALRAAAEEMSAAERGRLAGQEQEARDRRRVTTACLLAGAALSVGLAVAYYAVVRRDARRTAREMSRRRELERQLQQRAEALAEADRHKDEFLVMLAHELRNPLVPLLAAADAVERAAAEGAARAAAAVIGRQGRHMSRLVEDLLDAARLERGRVTLALGPLDLAALARSAAEDHRAGLEAAGVGLEVALPAAPVWVAGDGTRLAQVLANLLHNAGKFTPPGGRVVVAVDAGGGEARLAVRDTGVGIGAEALPRLFAPPGPGDGAAGGLGLGLALVKGLVELHGGRVAAASGGPGRGAEVSLTLPLLGAEAAPPPAPAPAAAPAGPAPVRRVLLVEDNVDAAAALRLLLEISGHAVEVAHTGPDGVAAARALRPHVVLCDLELPGLSGYGVARALRADPTTAAARLVALSGHSHAEARAEARAAGFDEHLVKPVSPETLRRLLAGAG